VPNQRFSLTIADFRLISQTQGRRSPALLHWGLLRKGSYTTDAANRRHDFPTPICYKHEPTDMPVYTSYVLRVWHAQEGRRWVCRAMLERVSTGQRTGFADLPSLIAFLQAEAEESIRVADAATNGAAEQRNAPNAPFARADDPDDPGELPV
jgi:hypothetical protein